MAFSYSLNKGQKVWWLKCDRKKINKDKIKILCKYNVSYELVVTIVMVPGEQCSCIQKKISR